ncbi:Alpha-D-glucose-1-phosphate phosphatase [Madurella fahalii]|uniref:Alpha-D-glucose-1-phosphate phosphatase n=1 Tax=Madurella fahalii TaxID=1157608 RepID=A0ABQ0GNK3_9PEZI
MDSLQAPPRGVIFDLGDVLLSWSAKTTTTIPAKKLRAILSTPVWYSYERGDITRDACYELSARQFSLLKSEIAEAFAQARQSLQPDHDIVAFIRELKKDSAIKVYAMSNVGKEDFEELATKLDWSLFDRVFTSGAAGMRKPELKFYCHVLDHIDLDGHQVVFIDDKEENVLAAQAAGIPGFVFGRSTIHVLREMFDSAVGKGWRYLFRNAETCDSITDSGVTFADNFAKLLIMDSLQDRTLIDLRWGSRKTWNFFAGKTALVPGGYFPDDLDTTALALQVLRPVSPETVSSVLDKMAEYVNDDGTFQTYFDRDRPRVDPVVSANILACFYSYNRGHEFERTLQLVHSMLKDCSYMQGTRYYPSPDCCLGFIGRLLRSSSDPHLQMTLGPLLKSQVRKRVGLGGNALDLALRIITCTQMGIACEADHRTLLNLQCEDGSWEPGWMYRYGSTGVRIGNRGVTTAMAVAALSSRDIAAQGNGSCKPNGMGEVVNLIDAK